MAEKTVARIMKELGLKSRTVKKCKATTNSNHQLPVQENVLNHVCTRKIVGFHMDERMTKELVIQALDQAYSLQRPRGVPSS